MVQTRSGADPRIIWLAILVSNIIYVVVAYMAIVPAVPFAEGARHPLTIPLYVAAGTALAAAFIIPSFLARSRTTYGESMEPQPALPSLILKLALFESVTIFGLVLAFVSRAPSMILPAVAVAMAGILAAYPGRR